MLSAILLMVNINIDAMKLWLRFHVPFERKTNSHNQTYEIDGDSRCALTIQKQSMIYRFRRQWFHRSEQKCECDRLLLHGSIPHSLSPLANFHFLLYFLVNKHWEQNEFSLAFAWIYNVRESLRTFSSSVLTKPHMICTINTSTHYIHCLPRYCTWWFSLLGYFTHILFAGCNTNILELRMQLMRKQSAQNEICSNCIGLYNGKAVMRKHNNQNKYWLNYYLLAVDKHAFYAGTARPFAHRWFFFLIATDVGANNHSLSDFNAIFAFYSGVAHIKFATLDFSAAVEFVTVIQLKTEKVQIAWQMIVKIIAFLLQKYQN